MIRFYCTTLGLALLLAGCSPSSPKPESKTAEAHEAEEHGEHEELPQQTSINAKTAQTAGVRVAPVEPGEIVDEHEVQGLLTPVEGRVAQVTARFPGPVRSVRAGVGDPIRSGQVLATVESNLSLTNYSVTAPISGVVMARNASVVCRRLKVRPCLRLPIYLPCGWICTYLEAMPSTSGLACR